MRNYDWKRGLPPVSVYEGMTDDFEVYLSPGGFKWYRRRSAKDREHHRKMRTSKKEVVLKTVEET